MSGLDIEPWEPEETIGKLWHSFASRLDAPAALHEDARVTLDEVAGRVAVLFRGLGGGAAVEIRAAAPEAVAHRLSFRRKLGTIAERVPRASFDGGILRLPPEIAAFPDRSINAALYLWLAAAAAHSAPVEPEPDPLRADLAAIRAAEAMTRATLDAAPGLRGLHEGLAHAALALRPARRLAGAGGRDRGARPARAGRSRRRSPTPPAPCAADPADLTRPARLPRLRAGRRSGPTCAPTSPATPPPTTTRMPAPPVRRRGRKAPARPNAARPTRPSARTA